MLRRERENMHARVASRLDAVFPAWAERHPALVARHLTESRQWVPAAQRWLAAALRSLASCAYGESIAQANEGLALIRHMEGEGAAAMELALRSTLGPALIASTGFASDIVGQTYARAEALCSVVGDRPEAFPSLWGNWVYNLVSARLDVSLGYAQRMHAMGTACGSSAMLVEACWTRGNTHLWLGELAAADHWLAQAEAHYDFDAHGANAVHFGQDPGVAAACYRSMTLLHQGRLGDARQAWLQAQALGVRRDHPFSTAWVLAFDHMTGMNCNPTHALQASQRTLDFCYTQGAPFWIAAGHAVHGWAACKLGNRDEGLRELRMGMAMYEAIGSSLVQPEWHALLAECHLMAGEIDEAQGVIESGLVKAHRNRERLSDITLHTLRGECAVQSHDWAGAQAALETAIRIADECGAGWRRLLASTHLHRVYARTGQHERSALAHHLSQVSGGDHLVGVQAAMGLLNE
jgi:tetratricopeptide (TPR) repeat protein